MTRELRVQLSPSRYLSLLRLRIMSNISIALRMGHRKNFHLLLVR